MSEGEVSEHAQLATELVRLGVDLRYSARSPCTSASMSRSIRAMTIVTMRAVFHGRWMTSVSACRTDGVAHVVVVATGPAPVRECSGSR